MTSKNNNGAYTAECLINQNNQIYQTMQNMMNLLIEMKDSQTKSALQIQIVDTREKSNSERNAEEFKKLVACIEKINSVQEAQQRQINDNYIAQQKLINDNFISHQKLINDNYAELKKQEQEHFAETNTKLETQQKQINDLVIPSKVLNIISSWPVKIVGVSSFIFLLIDFINWLRSLIGT